MRVRSAAIIVTLALAILAAPLIAEAPAPTKARRIGFLGATSAAVASHVVAALQQGLRTRGWVEGENRLSDLAAELVRLKVDVIVAPTAPAVRAAKQATTTIPGHPVTKG